MKTDNKNSEQIPMPRGLRNHNPLNIRHNPANKWLGMKPEQTDPDFVQFYSHALGYRAAFRTFATYYEKYGLRTVKQVVGKWAPPSENATNHYISYVCKLVNISPDEYLRHPCIDRNLWKQLVTAMTRMECGPHIMEHYPELIDAINEGFAMAF